MSHHRPFLVLWVLAITATSAAFVLHLSMRSKAMHLGYELGRARAEQARLREVRRVIELEVASYHTPQRVEVVARSLLRMEPPSPDRIIAMSPAGVAQNPIADAPGARGAGRVQAMATPARSAAVPLPTPPAATELLAPRITPPKPLAATPEAP